MNDAAPLRQPRIGLGKMPAADEWHGPAPRRQRRGVIGLQQQDLLAAGRRCLFDQRRFCLRLLAPQHIDAVRRAACALGNYGVAELLPALAGMACGSAVLYREAGIEQQHALVRPGQQRR